nr:phage tail protein [uncultured Desulfobacter sp.]
MIDLFKNDEYPPAAFYFKVMFEATLGLVDTSFQEVSGINATIETEEVPEGGELFAHRLPKAVKYDNLILKRGIAKISSPLVCWCKSVLETDFITPVAPQSLCVFLQDGNDMPSRAWMFANAFPVKWQVGAFNSTKNEVALETIELTYNYFKRLI